jgi:hypothetical protein
MILGVLIKTVPELESMVPGGKRRICAILDAILFHLFTSRYLIVITVPQRINPQIRIAMNIGIRIDASLNPQWIALRVLSGSWIVIPEATVMQPHLPIENLSREPQVVGNCRSNKSSPLPPPPLKHLPLLHFAATPSTACE